MGIELDKMLVPLPESLPKGGENSEYDPLYLELEALAVGVPPSLMGILYRW